MSRCTKEIFYIVFAVFFFFGVSIYGEAETITSKNCLTYKTIVKASETYNVSKTLICAIIKTESMFRPSVVSSAGAIGLGQIMQRSALADVLKLDKRYKNKKISKQDLKNPDINIMITVSYISILQNRYLRNVKDAKIRELLSISAYNGGISTALRLFGKTKNEQINTLNNSNKYHVKWILTLFHPFGETKTYLKRVLKAKQKYCKLMKENK